MDNELKRIADTLDEIAAYVSRLVSDESAKPAEKPAPEKPTRTRAKKAEVPAEVEQEEVEQEEVEQEEVEQEEVEEEAQPEKPDPSKWDDDALYAACRSKLASIPRTKAEALVVEATGNATLRQCQGDRTALLSIWEVLP